MATLVMIALTVAVVVVGISFRRMCLTGSKMKMVCVGFV